MPPQSRFVSTATAPLRPEVPPASFERPLSRSVDSVDADAMGVGAAGPFRSDVTDAMPTAELHGAPPRLDTWWLGPALLRNVTLSVFRHCVVVRSGHDVQEIPLARIIRLELKTARQPLFAVGLVALLCAWLDLLTMPSLLAVLLGAVCAMLPLLRWGRAFLCITTSEGRRLYVSSRRRDVTEGFARAVLEAARRRARLDNGRGRHLDLASGQDPASAGPPDGTSGLPKGRWSHVVALWVSAAWALASADFLVGHVLARQPGLNELLVITGGMVVAPVLAMAIASNDEMANRGRTAGAMDAGDASEMQ